MKRNDKARAQARRLRQKGMSINEIAEKLGMSKSSIYGWTRDMPRPERLTPEARARRKAEREARLAEERQRRFDARPKRLLSGDGRWMIRTPSGYKGTTYIKGRYVYEHRYLMEQKLGRLLGTDEVVHHKNGDKLDNRLSNLELMTRGGHTSSHAKPAAMVTKTCPECHRRFTRTKRTAKTHCSRRCGSRATWKRRRAST